MTSFWGFSDFLPRQRRKMGKKLAQLTNRVVRYGIRFWVLDFWPHSVPKGTGEKLNSFNIYLYGVPHGTQILGYFYWQPDIIYCFSSRKTLTVKNHPTFHQPLRDSIILCLWIAYLSAFFLSYLCISVFYFFRCFQCFSVLILILFFLCALCGFAVLVSFFIHSQN